MKQQQQMNARGLSGAYYLQYSQILNGLRSALDVVKSDTISHYPNPNPSCLLETAVLRKLPPSEYCLEES